MKPEPLKDKGQCCEGVSINYCDRQEQFYHLDEDIKLAVEWLKSKGRCYDKMSHKKLTWKIVEDRWKCGLKNTMFFVVCYNDFNKAFEDVTK